MKKFKWYIANLISYPTIKDPQTKKVKKYKQYSYWDNLLLIKAENSEIAYKKALNAGKDLENQYINTKMELVEWKFIGVAELVEALDNFEDGNQITFYEGSVNNISDIKRLIPKKEKLRVIAWDKNILLEKKKFKEPKQH